MEGNQRRPDNFDQSISSTGSSGPAILPLHGTGVRSRADPRRAKGFLLLNCGDVTLLPQIENQALENSECPACPL
jgi:hypothetical protein